MLKAAVWVMAGTFAVGQVSAAGESYDDREVMKRTVDLTVALYNAIPQPRQCVAEAAKFGKDPIKGHLAELQSIARRLRLASTSEGPDEIRQLRAEFADKTGALAKAVAAYGAAVTSYASLDAQVKEQEKTKPKC